MRQEIREFQVANAAVSGGDPATLEVAALRTRLLLRAGGDRGVCLRAAGAHRRVPRRSAGRAGRHSSSRRSCRSARPNRLATVATELLGLFHQRGEALGGRVAATSRGAASELADFLMLQAINRYEPLLAHFAETRRHPSRGVLPILRGRGRRARDVHDDVEAHAEDFRTTGTII